MIGNKHSVQLCGGWTKSAHLMHFSTKPAGPVIISPDGLLPSLYRELVLRRPHEFKIRCRAIAPAIRCQGWSDVGFKANPLHSHCPMSSLAET